MALRFSPLEPALNGDVSWNFRVKLLNWFVGTDIYIYYTHYMMISRLSDWLAGTLTLRVMFSEIWWGYHEIIYWGYYGEVKLPPFRSVGSSFFPEPNGYLGKITRGSDTPTYAHVYREHHFSGRISGGFPLHHTNPSVMTSAVTVSVEVKVDLVDHPKASRLAAGPKFAHQLEIWRSSNHQAAAFLPLHEHVKNYIRQFDNRIS